MSRQAKEREIKNMLSHVEMLIDYYSLDNPNKAKYEALTEYKKELERKLAK